MAKNKNFLLFLLKDILGGKNPSNALGKLKQQLGALGFELNFKESKIQDYYDIEVYFKKEDCAFQCKYNKWWVITWWTIRIFDDSL